MKKVYLFLLFALLGLTAAAQTGKERLIIYDKSGSGRSILVDHIDRVEFPTLDVDPKIELVVTEVTEDRAYFNVTPSADCYAFRLLCISASQSENRSDMDLMLNIERYSANMYYESMTDVYYNFSSMTRGWTYEIIVVGYDVTGAACCISRTKFTVPELQLQGNPKVLYTVDEVTTESFSLSFTPNGDVGGYAVYVGGKGTLQRNFQNYGADYGCRTFGEMVKYFGTWYGAENVTRNVTGLKPGQDYQAFVQAWDVRGTLTGCDTINIRTRSLGGNGVAEVDITLGDVYEIEQDGERRQVRNVTFTPNKETNGYTTYISWAANYYDDPSWYERVLKENPTSSSSLAYHVGVYEQQASLSPYEDLVVLAAAQNAKGEWGPVTVREMAKADASAQAADEPQSVKVKTLPMKSKTAPAYRLHTEGLSVLPDPAEAAKKRPNKFTVIQ